MAKMKFFESLTGNAAERAEARASKLAAQLAETDRAIEAAEARRTSERRTLAEALGSGADATGPEAALAEIAGTVARLSERRAALADLVEKANAEAAEARRVASLDSAREALAEARTEAQEAKGKAVAAFIEAQKVAGRFYEAANRCGRASRDLRALDPEAETFEPLPVSLFFEAEKVATDAGLRPISSLGVQFSYLA